MFSVGLLGLLAAPVASISTSILTAKPDGDYLFWEPFREDPLAGRWTVSETPSATGAFDWSGPTQVVGSAEDKGLLLPENARRYAISSKFPAADTKGKDLVIQYELKLQQPLSCGGAYIKVLWDGYDQAKFSGDTPYAVMFGPDKCDKDRVHFIWKHTNPKTQSEVEHLLTDAPMIKNDRHTHLYTLHIKADNSWDILIDMDVVKSGTLYDDTFDKPLIPPKEIDDVTDIKPADWVDQEQIPDPEAKKPEDWDEDAPATIDDPESTKPDDWLDDEPKQVADPSADKPDDWDDEEDGDWTAPLIDNPACEDVSGCGVWRPDQMTNPEFKGKWYAPNIKNPAFIGHWKPKQVPNPEWFEDEHPSDFAALGGVGLELWTMQGEMLFDNILVTNDFKQAEAFAEATWRVEADAENEIEPLADPAESGPSFLEGLTSVMQEMYETNPTNFWIMAAFGLLIPVMMIIVCTRSSPPPPPAPKAPKAPAPPAATAQDSVPETKEDNAKPAKRSGRSKTGPRSRQEN